MFKKSLWILLCVFLYLTTSSLVASANTQLAATYPKRSSLVDTGYDLCRQNGGKEAACSSNKNLLFRGSNTFEDTDLATVTNHEDLYKQVFHYLKHFKNHAQTNAKLPQSLEELKSYRIVIINLMNGAPSNSNTDAEILMAEYRGSGVAENNNSNFPLQHHLYGNKRPFSAAQYDFMWWPITYYYWHNKPLFNAPNKGEKDKTIPGTYPPINYIPQDLPYLVTGKSYAGVKEKNAPDLKSLLLAKPQDPAHPVLIFYHCAGGKDRTGLVTMGYFMNNGGYANIDRKNKTLEQRNQPMSYSQALKAVTKGKWPTPSSLPVAKEYCQSIPGKDCK